MCYDRPFSWELRICKLCRIDAEITSQMKSLKSVLAKEVEEEIQSLQKHHCRETEELIAEQVLPLSCFSQVCMQVISHVPKCVKWMIQRVGVFLGPKMCLPHSPAS